MVKKLSIIIPAYNIEKYIDECINNILNQTYKNYEVLFVDDHSNDKTKNSILKYVKTYEFVKYYLNTKKGVSSARNYGIANSTGDYIVFLDADDFISPIFLETLINMVDTNENDCAVVSYTINKENLSISSEANIIDISNKKYEILIDSKYSVGGYVWNKIYKKSLLNKYNIRFDENISVGEDLLFNIEYFSKSSKIMYRKTYLYYYKLNVNSAVNNLNNEKWFDAIKVYKKLLKFDFSSEIKNYYKFLYSQIILEALYRLKFCKKSPYSKKELKELKKKYTKLSLNYSVTQNIKIILFKMFPNIVMKYKRKSIKEN